MAQNVVPTGPMEMSNYHAKSGHRYTLRTDGFVSLRAGAERGEMVTRPFRFSGDTLLLNLSTSAAGDLAVEMQDERGRPLCGFTLEESRLILGDAIAKEAGWRDDPDLGAPRWPPGAAARGNEGGGSLRLPVREGEKDRRRALSRAPFSILRPRKTIVFTQPPPTLMLPTIAIIRPTGQTLQACLLMAVFAWPLAWKAPIHAADASKPADLAQLREQRAEAAQRPRRILYNNDGDDHILIGPVSVQAFFDRRTTALLDSQVDTLIYCTSRPFGVFTHATRVGDALTTQEGYHPSRRNVVADFLGQGTDPLRLMVEYSHAHRKEVFWSMRMNDTHDAAHSPDGPQPYWSRFKAAHRDWLFGTRSERPAHGRWSGIDFAQEEVRDFLFRAIEEVCRNYDVDGIELDFFRHLVFFKSVADGGHASPEEVAMMTDLMRRIQEMTEVEGLRRGRPILVAMRVPDSLEFCREMGLDLEHCLEQRLTDILVTTCYFRLNPWEYSIELGRRFGLPVYPCLSDSRVRGGDRFERSSLEAYRGRAMNAWAAGADGIHLFNQFNPKHPLWWDLGDPETLRRLDKLYFVTVRDGDPDRFLVRGSRHRTIPILTPAQPVHLTAGESVTLPIVIGDDPETLAREGAALACHLQLPQIAVAGQVSIDLNGHRLDGGTGSDGWVDWPLRPAWLRKGSNQFRLALEEDRLDRDSWEADTPVALEMPSPWARGKGHREATALMQNGHLVISDQSDEPGSYLYYSYPWNADPKRLAAVEIEARVIEGRSGLIVANGSLEEELHFHPDKIRLRHAGLAHAMETTAGFHTYRVEFSARSLRVFVDGELRLDAGGQIAHPASSGRNVAMFGAANSPETGSAAWRSVRLRTGSRRLHDMVVSIRFPGGNPSDR